MKNFLLILISLTIVLFVSCGLAAGDGSVTGITGIPDWTIVGKPLTLNGKVLPYNAANKEIVWSIKPGPALLNGNILTATAAGTVVVTATVKDGKEEGVDYTREFRISVFEGSKLWAINHANNTPYQLDAAAIIQGVHCNIWVEFNSGVNITMTTAQRIANEYDMNIYDKLITGFNLANVADGLSIMDIADQYGNNDGKLCILLLDIKDNYDAVNNRVSVRGYFNHYDLFKNGSHTPNGVISWSNERDIVYIDINPLMPETEEFYATLVHEVQHLMNYTASLEKRDGIQMDTWIDEGLSAIAEWIYADNHNYFNIYWYNNDVSGLIERGNNFYVWGNRRGTNAGNDPLAIIDDYATVYLFFHWLRLQANDDTKIFGKILTSLDYDFYAVTHEAGYYIHADFSNWDVLLKTWLAANYINAPVGRYGYRDDPVLRNVQGRPTALTGLSLFPGEGVYSISNNISQLPMNTQVIKYVGLQTSSPYLDDTYMDNVLLSYNVNTNTSGRAVGAYTTGSPVFYPLTSISRSLKEQLLKRPFPVSMRDFQKMNEMDDEVVR